MSLKQLLTRLNPWAKKEEAVETPTPVEPETPIETPTPVAIIPPPPVEAKVEPKKEAPISMDTLAKETLLQKSEGLVSPDKKYRKYIKVPKSYLYTIAKYIATCDRLMDVIMLIKADTGIEVTDSYLIMMSKRPKWKTYIENQRLNFLADVSSVPGYHEKVRLERADFIYQYAVKTSNPELALRATELQRREVKEKPGEKPVSVTFNQYNTLSDDEIEEKKKELMVKLGRVIDMPTKEITSGPSGKAEAHSK